MAFDEKFSTFPFIREGKIPPIWKYFVQIISKRVAPDNIDLKDTWFTPDIEEDIRKNLRNEARVYPENKINMITLSPSQTNIHEGL